MSALGQETDFDPGDGQCPLTALRRQSAPDPLRTSEVSAFRSGGGTVHLQRPSKQENDGRAAEGQQRRVDAWVPAGKRSASRTGPLGVTMIRPH